MRFRVECFVASLICTQLPTFAQDAQQMQMQVPLQQGYAPNPQYQNAQYQNAQYQNAQYQGAEQMPPQSQGKNINLPFCNIHIGHGLSINAPFAHVDKLPGMPARVAAPYTAVDTSLGSNGTHVRAPLTAVDSPGYRGQPTQVRAPFTNVGQPRHAQYNSAYNSGNFPRSTASTYSVPEHE